jgi:hypothetical protein
LIETTLPDGRTGEICSETGIASEAGVQDTVAQKAAVFALQDETLPVDRHYRRLTKQDEILQQYSPENQVELLKRTQQLSALAYYIGRDFELPVELNEPGAGWHWDFARNVIRIDPEDLLHKSMAFHRFVICHEGAHRRLTAIVDGLKEFWEKPGYGFLANCIEDPRINNFLLRSFPPLRSDMEQTYSVTKEIEKKSEEFSREKLGYTPRFVTAGLALINQWLEEEGVKRSDDPKSFSPEVKEFLESVSRDASKAWHCYPSKGEADSGQTNIDGYAALSYAVVQNRIWPKFKKLLELDQKDARLQEALQRERRSQEGHQQSGRGKAPNQHGQQSGTPSGEKERGSEGAGAGKAEESSKSQQNKGLSGKSGQGGGDSSPLSATSGKSGSEGSTSSPVSSKGGIGSREESDQENRSSGVGSGLSEGLSQEMQRELEKVILGAKDGEPVPLESISKELKDKLQKAIDDLPDKQREELEKEAARALDRVNKDLEQEIQRSGREGDSANGKTAVEGVSRGEDPKTLPEKRRRAREIKQSGKPLTRFQEAAQAALKKDRGPYQQAVRDNIGLIREIERHIEEEFERSRAESYLAGHSTGDQINIGSRISEVASGVRASDSRAWEQRTELDLFDHAVTVLFDLSPSMKGERVQKAFEAGIAISEGLSKSGIPVELLGFHWEFLRFKHFNEPMSVKVREKVGGMLTEVLSVLRRKGQKRRFSLFSPTASRSLLENTTHPTTRCQK